MYNETRRINLPSDIIHQCSKRILPAIHLYDTDPRDDLIHCAYSVICQDCCLSPETAEITELIPVLQITKAETNVFYSWLICSSNTNLSLENKRPNRVCSGIKMKKTDIPARHDGPIAYINNKITIAACRGPIHRKCKYKVTCKITVTNGDIVMKTDVHYQSCAEILKHKSSDKYLIKFVDIIGQEVYNLSCGRFGKCFAVKTKSLCRTKALNQVPRTPRTWQNDDIHTKKSRKD